MPLSVITKEGSDLVSKRCNLLTSRWVSVTNDQTRSIEYLLLTKLLHATVLQVFHWQWGLNGKTGDTQQAYVLCVLFKHDKIATWRQKINKRLLFFLSYPMPTCENSTQTDRFRHCRERELHVLLPIPAAQRQQIKQSTSHNTCPLSSLRATCIATIEYPNYSDDVFSLDKLDVVLANGALTVEISFFIIHMLLTIVFNPWLFSYCGCRINGLDYVASMTWAEKPLKNVGLHAYPPYYLHSQLLHVGHETKRFSIGKDIHFKQTWQCTRLVMSTASIRCQCNWQVYYRLSLSHHSIFSFSEHSTFLYTQASSTLCNSFHDSSDAGIWSRQYPFQITLSTIHHSSAYLDP